MNETKIRKNVILALNELLSAPYEWGGEVGKGFGIDCSGFAKIAVYSFGFNLGVDMTANDLRNYFKGCEIKRSEAKPGDLYFYGKQKITHVCVCYSVWDYNKNYRTLVGANGGGSKIKTLKDAWEADAFVKIIRDTYRLSELNCVVNPLLKPIQ